MGIADFPRGVVGLGLFGPRVVTIDYPREKLIVESGALPEPDGKTILKATFDDGIPSLPIDVAGVAFSAHLDSGSTGFLGLPAGAAKTLPLEAAPIQVGRARTASGDYAVLEARLKGSVRIGALGLDESQAAVRRVFRARTSAPTCSARWSFRSIARTSACASFRPASRSSLPSVRGSAC